MNVFFKDIQVLELSGCRLNAYVISVVTSNKTPKSLINRLVRHLRYIFFYAHIGNFDTYRGVYHP